MKNYSRWISGLAIGIVILTVLLTGCAPTSKNVWYQQGKDLPTFKQDKLQCEEEAALYAKHMNQRGNEALIKSRFKECLEINGYTQALEKDVPKGAAKFE
ncbi:MAG: hypothetical protein HQK55_08555 [Deltaproteobacteria bacterium]|nr:hypothetical protein [Deltaproteobacteria bacterium]